MWCKANSYLCTMLAMILEADSFAHHRHSRGLSQGCSPGPSATSSSVAGIYPHVTYSSGTIIGWIYSATWDHYGLSDVWWAQ